MLQRFKEQSPDTLAIMMTCFSTVEMAVEAMKRGAYHYVTNITCSALPEQLLESELFGHDRGAFTDARQQKRAFSRPRTAARSSSTKSVR